MIKNIVTHRFLLRRAAKPADERDLWIAKDLRDTLEAHRIECVGMAANMIGQNKAIICVFDEAEQTLLMLNPKITDAWEPYQTHEGCLCLPGTQACERFRHIRVTWQDEDLSVHTRHFTGDVAEAIQHECDHLKGIVI